MLYKKIIFALLISAPLVSFAKDMDPCQGLTGTWRGVSMAHVMENPGYYRCAWDVEWTVLNGYKNTFSIQSKFTVQKNYHSSCGNTDRIITYTCKDALIQNGNHWRATIFNNKIHYVSDSLSQTMELSKVSNGVSQ